MKERYVFLGVALVAVIVLAAISWHSVEEIHYLKGFYTGEFTVSEAKDAAVIELVKVLLVALPLAFAFWAYSITQR